MAHQGQGSDTKRVVYPPQPMLVPGYPAVTHVVLEEDEDVEWQWTHFEDGRTIVTGYTIIKKAPNIKKAPE